MARLGTGTTAKEITESLQMPPATAYRLLNSLVSDEYLARTSDLRGFALGHAISGLITAATPPTVSTAAHDAIEEFRDGTRFAVHLIMFRNASLRIGDEDPDHPLNSAFELMRYPYASAAGKLMLAGLGDSESSLPRGRLMKLTASTITNRTELKIELAEIRLKNEASDINELEQGSATLAFPVGLPNRSAGAALCLGSTPERFTAICEHSQEARELTLRLAPLLF